MCGSINVITDVVIPILSALIGGGITLLGVIITIKAENKKAKKDYLERIRPFFVIENSGAIDVKQGYVKKIWVQDDSSENVEGNQIIYHWDSLLVSNMSSDVCMISYIKINNQVYASFDNEPVKPGDFCEIKGAPLSVFISKYIDSISIGFLDKNFNLYEYKVDFEIKECVHEVGGLKNYCHKTIDFLLIRCNKNLAPKQKNK